METLFDQSTPKKSVNLSLNSDLLKKSKAMNINLSATLEQALKDLLARDRAEKWQEENKNAIKSYNRFIDEHGCFGEEYWEF